MVIYMTFSKLIQMSWINTFSSRVVNIMFFMENFWKQKFLYSIKAKLKESNNKD